MLCIVYGSTMSVEIYGKNLAELFYALKAWRVEFIQEIDVRICDRPSDPKSPVIERIEIHTPQTAASVPESTKKH